MIAKLVKVPTACAATALLGLAACSPSPATQSYASENLISFRYTAWDTVLTLTPEAMDRAAKHCAQYGKYANYKGGNAVNPLISAEEEHTFACESVKTDDSLIIAKQSERPDIQMVQPVHTSCTMYGNTANCMSF